MNFGNIWDTISGVASNVGKSIGNAASSVWNTITNPTQQSQGTAALADVGKTAGGLMQDVLGIFGPSTTKVLPANSQISYGAGGEPYSPSASQTAQQKSIAASAPGGVSPYYNPTPTQTDGSGNASPSTYSGNKSSSAPSTGYNPPSASFGGYSFIPSSPAPAGYGWNSKGGTYILPTAQSGSSGKGSVISGGGSGNVPAPRGSSGNFGGGGSASLGAGSAIQGGSDTGTVADTSGQDNKNNTQKIAAPKFIPYSGFNSPTDIAKLGLTQTTTPQGGTGYTDSQGNFYKQDNTGFTPVTSLPGGTTPTLSQNGQNYSLQPAPGIQTQLGQGRVYTMTDGQGNVSYFVQTQQGFSPVIGGNLNGQTTGQLTGQLGAPNQNIQISSQAPGNVPVGNQPQQTSAAGDPNAGNPPISIGNTNAPAFNAGGISNPLDIGGITDPGSGTVGDVANAVASGAVSPQTLDQFNTTLQNQINGIVSSMSSGSGIDPSTNYNIDPSLVANGDQNILNNIQSDPTGFSAINAQFGVPQLQKQYLSSLSTIGGITSAVAQLTQQILTDPNMPKGLAQNQISYLGNQANLILTPFTAQANTVKAQLSYATANMRTYYSNYWKGQTMNMNQLKLALTNNAITPANAAQWAQATGMDPNTLMGMATFKTALNLATLNNKEAVAQSNEMLASLAADPTSVQNILSGIQNGMLDPSVINSIPSRGGGAVLKMRVIQGAADMGVNLAGSSANYKFSSATNVKQQVAALQNVQALIPDMEKLSQNAPRSVGAINQYLLPAGTKIGNVAYSNFSEGVTAMADELSGALGFGSATDMSREMGYNLTDPNQTPEQFNSAMETIVKPFIQQKAAALYTQMGQYAPTGNGGSATPAAGSGSSPAPAANATDPLNLNL